MVHVPGGRRERRDRGEGTASSSSSSYDQRQRAIVGTARIVVAAQNLAGADDDGITHLSEVLGVVAQAIVDAGDARDARNCLHRGLKRASLQRLAEHEAAG